jgi:DNA primase catalytic core
MMDALAQLKDLDIKSLFPGELKNNVGKCPFPGHTHPQTGKSPPFRYYPGENTFHCFGCQAHGTTIDFWMHLHGFSDVGRAIRDLAERQGITLEKWTPDQEERLAKSRREEEALNYATAFYHRHLLDEKNERVVRYLLDRGFTMETITERRLGFANCQLVAAVRGDSHLAEMGVTEEDFKAVGLFKEDENGVPKDFFRHRIIWPVMRRGRVIHMSGRALPQAITGMEEPAPKYLNLKRDLQALYLEDNIKDHVYLFEGLPDTTLMAQWGLPAVGQMGTGGAAKQAKKFAKCRALWVCFDNDKAGMQSVARTTRAIQLEMEAGEVRVLFPPPPAKDWNDWAMAGNGPEQFKELADQAPNLIAFLLSQIPTEAGPLEQEVALRDLLTLLVPMGPIRRDHYLKTIRDRLGTKLSDLRAMLTGLTAEKADGDGPKESRAASELAFTTIKEIIPAQYYAFNSPAKGNITTFLTVKRNLTDKEGNPRPVERVEPVMVMVTHNDGDRVIKAVPCLDLKLSEAEERRVPNENGVRGRWRPEGKYPHSVERFIQNQVDEVDGWELFTDIVAVIRRHIWLPSTTDPEIIAVWIMGTYMYQMFEAYSYLHLVGVRGSAKTDIAKIIEELAFNALKASSQSESVIFRATEQNCRTVIVEEAEKLNNPKPGSPEQNIMLLLNDGYKKGAKAERNDKDPVTGKFKPVPYDIYSPKVLASIADLNYVLASRCIHIKCLRAKPEEMDATNITDLTSSMHYERKVFAELRDRLYCWALLHFPEVHQAYLDHIVASPALKHLRAREREMWLPLLTIAFCLDNVRAGGDATRLAELREQGDLLTIRLMEAQKTKERGRKLVESDQSIEVATVKAVLEVMQRGEFLPIRSDLSGSFYIIKHLAELVTEELREVGLLTFDKAMTGYRMTTLLLKTQAITEEDRKDIKVDGKKERCIALNDGRLRETVMRLGGEVLEATG